MAKGDAEKLIVANKIKEMFPNAFDYEKTIRIPINGVEIKLQMVCAAKNVGGVVGTETMTQSIAAPSEVSALTDDEKQSVADLCKMLGF